MVGIITGFFGVAGTYKIFFFRICIFLCRWCCMSKPYRNGICIWKKKKHKTSSTSAEAVTQPHQGPHPPVAFVLSSPVSEKKHPPKNISQKNAEKTPLQSRLPVFFFVFWRLSGVDDGNIQFMEKMFPINTSVARCKNSRSKKNTQNSLEISKALLFFFQTKLWK